MKVWDHERAAGARSATATPAARHELKKVITALLETPFEELDKWDDRPLREWILQHTPTRA